MTMGHDSDTLVEALIEFIEEVFTELDDSVGDNASQIEDITDARRSAGNACDRIISLVKKCKSATEEEKEGYLDDIESEADDIDSKLWKIGDNADKLHDNKIDIDEFRKRLEILRVKMSL